MSRKFQLERDCYDEGFNLYKKKIIEIKSGVTVLVGCNGIGKTTLLKQIRDKLKENKIPYIMFDNLHDGGSKAISEASFYSDFGDSLLNCYSAGEKSQKTNIFQVQSADYFLRSLCFASMFLMNFTKKFVLYCLEKSSAALSRVKSFPYFCLTSSQYLMRKT